MLLKALFDYAHDRRLLENLHLQRRKIHALIPLDLAGNLRFSHLLALTEPDEKGREVAGQTHWLPRFPGENNGGKAYFLAESCIAILGRDKTTGVSIPSVPESALKKDRNPAKAFRHFWEQIAQAHSETGDTRLAALLAFKSRYLVERDGLIVADLPFLRMRPKDKGKNKGELEFVANLGISDSQYLPVEKALIGFSVDANPLTLDQDDDPLRRFWSTEYSRLAFVSDTSEADNEDSKTQVEPTICLLTGETGLPIARSHKPKILGIPGIAAGGYIVSFAKESPAYSSYGFVMGQNSPVSETAAAGYALALTELLADDDRHLTIGPLAVCFWAKSIDQASQQFTRLLGKAYPEHVRQFLLAPFAGVSDRDILNKDRLYTVALSGNAGRIVVQHWLDQPLAAAIEHFGRWWKELQIVPLFTSTSTEKRAKPTNETDSGEPPPSPYAIPNLSRVSLRRSKKQKDDRLVSERIVQLYRAALDGTSLPAIMLRTILDEFHSALVKNDDSDPNKRTFPFNLSRFALIKLILLRNRKEGDFMPSYELADTPDAAYNLGRLLAVFENLQDKYHNYDKKGPGVVDRYYATASSAPASAFPLLCRLARHHLSKVRKEDGAAAYRIEERMSDILAKVQPSSLGQPPLFPRLLTLVEQGRFALGFYQQKASRPKKEDNDAAAPPQ